MKEFIKINSVKTARCLIGQRTFSQNFAFNLGIRFLGMVRALKGSDHSEFFILAMYKIWISVWFSQQNYDMLYIFCYANFSRFWKFKNRNEKNNEEENEDFYEEEYFNFEELTSGEEKTFWKYFCIFWCIFCWIKNIFSENFCKSFFVSKSSK